MHYGQLVAFQRLLCKSLGKRLALWSEIFPPLTLLACCVWLEMYPILTRLEEPSNWTLLESLPRTSAESFRNCQYRSVATRQFKVSSLASIGKRSASSSLVPRRSRCGQDSHWSIAMNHVTEAFSGQRTAIVYIYCDYASYDLFSRKSFR